MSIRKKQLDYVALSCLHTCGTLVDKSPDTGSLVACHQDLVAPGSHHKKRCNRRSRACRQHTRQRNLTPPARPPHREAAETTRRAQRPSRCILSHYGQEHSRLSRDQPILFDPEPKYRWISNIMACFTFKTSDGHLARLDDVFVDHMVYVDRWARLVGACWWARLVGACLKQWRASASGAFAGLMLHLPFLVLNSGWPALLTVSATLFISALMSSILLEHIYEPMEDLSATDAMNYLERIQSPVFKFQFIALAFSIPKALQLWGYLMLLANCLLLVSNYFGLRVAVGFTGLLCLVILALYVTTSGTLHLSWGKCMRLFRREDATIQMV
ncbi:hypothetical protein B0H10DRAFT_1966896 [Mycena sp. CBHHK59/15]|nr:hypothetical protein B0H10DRAFT_1966896 [Mycena sp. CBHHK59/15]